MKDIYNNVKKNYDTIENYRFMKKNHLEFINHNQNNYFARNNNNYESESYDFEININQIINFNEQEKPVNKDILDYFLDYGLCLFFDVSCKEIPCIKKVFQYFS